MSFKSTSDFLTNGVNITDSYITDKTICFCIETT